MDRLRVGINATDADFRLFPVEYDGKAVNPSPHDDRYQDGLDAATFLLQTVNTREFELCCDPSDDTLTFAGVLIGLVSAGADVQISPGPDWPVNQVWVYHAPESGGCQKS